MAKQAETASQCEGKQSAPLLVVMYRSVVKMVVIATLFLGSSETVANTISEKSDNAKAQIVNLPRTRWETRPGSDEWTRAALETLEFDAVALTQTVPDDMDFWCPTYATAQAAQRRAFWVGFLSALALYESTYNPNAVGGGGRWFGLLQIQPSTASAYACSATTGEALTNGAANSSCAIRIMAVTVPRDGVIAVKAGRWKGAAADWGPLRSASKRKSMAAWLNRQKYCRPLNSVRPRTRPE